MFPIIFANEDDTVTIIRLTGDEKTNSRLRDLGIGVGSNLKILSKNGKDLIVLAKESRLAITGNMASKIFVKEGDIYD